MTSSIKILTTSTLDSSPSIILIAPNGKHTLINCGEGCQRSFLDTRSDGINENSATQGGRQGLRIRAIDQICLTNISHAEVGGLPGMILTSADAAGENSKSKKKKDEIININTGPKKRSRLMHEGQWSGRNKKKAIADLEIIGPSGLNAFMHSLRHFMRRDNFDISVKEGCYDSLLSSGDVQTKDKANILDEKKNNTNSQNQEKKLSRKQRKKRNAFDNHDSMEKTNSNGGFYVRTIPISIPEPSTTNRSHPNVDNDSIRRGYDINESINEIKRGNNFQAKNQVMSYLFTTPPIPGKFNIKRALELGIPKGPLYSKLKNGHTVTYTSTIDGLEKTVSSEEVMIHTVNENDNNDGKNEKASKNDTIINYSCPNGVAIGVICSPNIFVLKELKKDDSKIFEAFLTKSNHQKIKSNEKTEKKNERQFNGDDTHEKNADQIMNDTSKANLSMSKKKVELDCMIHLTPKHLFHHSEYQSWLTSFQENVQHILLPTNSSIVTKVNDKECIKEDSSEMNDDVKCSNRTLQNDDMNEEEILETLFHKGRSPYNTAFIGAMSRNLIDNDLYTRPCPIIRKAKGIVAKDENDKESKEERSISTLDKKQDTDRCTSIVQIELNKKSETVTDEKIEAFKYVEAAPFLEFVIIPRAKKGFKWDNVQQKIFHNHLTAKEFKKLSTKVNDLGAKELANQIKDKCNDKPNQLKLLENEASSSSTTSHASFGELTFTGTGSAIPCKHRNVTGNYLQMKNGNAVLLDVGEGTTGQLLRSWSSTETPNTKSLLSSICMRLVSIKAIWISHPHADHHLGLLRFLSERRKVCQAFNSLRKEDPPILIAPMPIFRFLEDYAIADPSIRGSYIPLDCKFLPTTNEGKMNIQPFIRQKLLNDLGITQIHCIPVAHCAHAHAILITGTLCPFGKRIAFSGDCRPSDRLTLVGKGADILIHEATFEDGMEEEAVLKRHSTVSEAVNIGVRMGVKYVVLTHFSQRYPKIPAWNSKAYRAKSVEDPFKQPEKNEVGQVSNDDTLLIAKEKALDNELGPTKIMDADDTVGDVKVIFAFDFMTLKETNIDYASKITPVLRLLYPETRHSDEIECDEVNIANNETQSLSAKELLSIPGVFADSSLFKIQCN